MNTKIILIALSLGSSIFGFAQTVPSSISSEFSTRFPDAKSIDWEQEKNGDWEAEFKIQGIEFSAVFSEKTGWMETEQEVRESEVPSLILEKLATDFKGYKIEEMEKVERPGFLGYEFEIELKENSLDVLYDQNGKLISQEKSE